MSASFGIRFNVLSSCHRSVECVFESKKGFPACEKRWTQNAQMKRPASEAKNCFWASAWWGDDSRDWNWAARIFQCFRGQGRNVPRKKCLRSCDRSWGAADCIAHRGTIYRYRVSVSTVRSFQKHRLLRALRQWWLSRVEELLPVTGDSFNNPSPLEAVLPTASIRPQIRTKLARSVNRSNCLADKTASVKPLRLFGSSV